MATYTRQQLIDGGYGVWAAHVLRGALEDNARATFTDEEVLQTVAEWLTTPQATGGSEVAGFRSVVMPVGEEPAEGDIVWRYGEEWVAEPLAGLITTGSTGFRGPFAPSTEYKAHDLVIAPSSATARLRGRLVSANADFTSGGSFSAANWTLAEHAEAYTGAFAATTDYTAGQVVSYLGQLYSAKIDFTSGASFLLADWDPLSTQNAAAVAVVTAGDLTQPNVQSALENIVNVRLPAVGSDSAAAFGLSVAWDPYGATGEAAQTDAAARINDALEVAHEIGDTTRNSSQGGAQVFVPYGTYTADEPVLGKGGTILQGAGAHQSVIKRKANTDTELFNLATLEENSWALRDLKFDGDRNNQTVDADVIRLERSATILDDIPGYLAGPDDPDSVSALFGGGDFIPVNNIVISDVLGTAIRTMGQNAQLMFDHIFAWWISEHGIHDGGVDSDWTLVQVGNCGKTCFTIAGANGRYSHFKLYESDADGEGWPAVDVTGTKNMLDLFEIQEANGSGARFAGSDNTASLTVDGAMTDAVVINGHHNTVEAKVRQFNQYRPTHSFAFGTGARGNLLTLNHRDYSVAAGRGDLRSNTVKVAGGVLS